MVERHCGDEGGGAGALGGQPGRALGAFLCGFYGVLQAFAPGIGGPG